MCKTKQTSGADEFTPSIPQYFSWINNTNEGSTEEQTLANLAFFRYMQETYGMQIALYAWDAGNFDGAANGFGNVNSIKFLSQYPNGYKKVVETASTLGIHMGLWGSPDGFGEDEETQKNRVDFFVHLCRDYHFGLFKFDHVCGDLRPEKAGVLRKMLFDCRKYVPELIVLNHRLNLYEAEECVTTFLLGGQEAYTDVNIRNQITAMHHRAYLFSRSHSPQLARLTEDHGVCLSSALDYFEDELIYQAFCRSLILAPEIYGNPWFLKDEELPRLARIYNLHRQVRDILVHGQLLPEQYGPNACVRGNETHRFLTTGNDTWDEKQLVLRLDEEIGLCSCENIRVALRFPYEKYLGEFAYHDEIVLPLRPFRACLIEISAGSDLLPVLTNCEYRVITEDGEGKPVKVEYIRSAGGQILLKQGDSETVFDCIDACDNAEFAPVYLGNVEKFVPPCVDAEYLFETAMFAIDNDSLERQCVKRSGESKIPQLRRCRELFFGQQTYILRGCESSAMFDDDPLTFFDGQSKTYQDGQRIQNGCLRIDLRETIDADRIEIECFATDNPTREVLSQSIPLNIEFSKDLKRFSASAIAEINILEPDAVIDVVDAKYHTLYQNRGKRLKITYRVNDGFRYLRLAEPMDRIFSVRFFKGEHRIIPSTPKANNLQPHFTHFSTNEHVLGTVMLPAFSEGKRLAIAVNGNTGNEGISFCVKVDNKYYGCSDRAPSFRVNNWESFVRSSAENNTFFFDLPRSITNNQVEIIGSLHYRRFHPLEIKTYLCDMHK